MSNQCSECGKNFSHPSNLADHSRCPFCNKVFSRNDRRKVQKKKIEASVKDILENFEK